MFTLLFAVACTLAFELNMHAAEKGANVKVADDVRAISNSNNQFAFDLYGQLRTEESGNLFFSPTSISTALAMTYAGAAGQTEKEMANVLHFRLQDDQIHSAYASLHAILNRPEKQAYELRIANRLWGQMGYGFLPDFLATTRKQYGAELAQVDFMRQTEAARQEINTWVEDETKNKITDLIPRSALDSMTRLVLTNAIYFKGKWANPFDKKATKNAPFNLSENGKVEAPLMFQKEKFRYSETDTLLLLELPYVGDDLSMLVLLPKKVNGLPALEKMLSADNLETWSSRLRKQEVQTYIPRFKLTEQFQLNATLSTLGMPSAFQPNKANFSRMNGKSDLFISAALHKAFVDVNEEGTEAAAATGIVVGVTSIQPRPVVFRADHPFVFLIREKNTGSVLFMGRVMNPQA
jgi:serpin B